MFQYNVCLPLCCPASPSEASNESCGGAVAHTLPRAFKDWTKLRLKHLPTHTLHVCSLAYVFAACVLAGVAGVSFLRCPACPRPSFLMIPRWKDAGAHSTALGTTRSSRVSPCLPSASAHGGMSGTLYPTAASAAASSTETPPAVYLAHDCVERDVAVSDSSRFPFTPLLLSPVGFSWSSFRAFGVFFPSFAAKFCMSPTPRCPWQ